MGEMLSLAQPDDHMIGEEEMLMLMLAVQSRE